NRDVAGDLGAHREVAVEVDDIDRVFAGVLDGGIGHGGLATDHSAGPAADNGAHRAAEKEADGTAGGATNAGAGNGFAGLRGLSQGGCGSAERDQGHAEKKQLTHDVFLSGLLSFTPWRSNGSTTAWF